MADGRIPESLIQELRERIDVLAFIQARIGPLKKAGDHHWARCPFHEERSASFSVHPQRQSYHCFGCGAHGDVFAFAMQYQHLSFPEAVALCAEEAGMSMPEIQRTEALAPAYAAMEAAMRFYQQQLKSPQGQPARAYLAQRGVSHDLVERFSLGFAPARWDALCQTLKVPHDVLAQAGLVIRKNDRVFDRFRNRLMFPIRDQRGRVIGFGGRVLDEALPKYLNSPETALFHKHTALYGWYEAPRTQKKRVLLVEGYMDVIGVAKHPDLDVMATMGTVLSETHMHQLSRCYQHLYLCFDGDAAGRKASWSAVERLLPLLKEESSCWIAHVPHGHDPDSLVKQQGFEALDRVLAEALPLSEYIVTVVAEQTGLDSVEGKASYLEKMRRLLKPVQASTFKTLLWREAQKRAGVLQQRVGAPVVAQRNTSRTCSLAKVLFLALGQHPEWHQELGDLTMLHQQPLAVEGMSALLLLLGWLGSQTDVPSPACVQDKQQVLWPETAGQKSLLSGEALKQEALSAKNRLLVMAGQQQLAALLMQAKERSLTGSEQETLRTLLQQGARTSAST